MAMQQHMLPRWTVIFGLGLTLLSLIGCQPPLTEQKEQLLKSQYQVFMHQQPKAPPSTWQHTIPSEPTTHNETDAVQHNPENQIESTETTAVTEDAIQFLYPTLDVEANKSLITDLYSVFAIRHAQELDAFLTQHHLRYSKYFSESLQKQLDEIDFAKSVLIVVSKPDLSKLLLQHAKADQEEASELEQALLYSELSLMPSNDENLQLRINISYSGEANTLEQLVKPQPIWDTDFYLVPIKKKQKLILSFPQKGLTDEYSLVTPLKS